MFEVPLQKAGHKSDQSVCVLVHVVVVEEQGATRL